MIYRSAHLIYNPNAGRLRGRGLRKLEKAVRILTSAGHQIVSNATSRPGHATELARCAVASAADLILIAGGDGTVNEALNGMVGSQVPLAVLPGGTANVLARETRQGTNMARVAECFHELVPHRIGLGLLRTVDGAERHFLLMAGAGLDDQIVRMVRKDLKAKFGKAAYWVAALSMLGRPLPKLEAALNGQSVAASFVLASRVRNYGGDFTIARGASLKHDFLEVVTFNPASPLGFLKYLGGVLAGNLGRMRGIEIASCRSLDLLAPGEANVGVQVDGEHAGFLPASVEMARDALTLLAPPALR